MNNSSALGSMMPIILLVIIGIVIYTAYKKKKASNDTGAKFISNRKNKDEVWTTIKQYLKSNGEYGKKIEDVYVVKRHDIDYVDPAGTIYDKINKNAEIKIRRYLDKIKKTNAKKQGKIYVKPDTSRSLFVIVFTTKNLKTDVIDSPRCIEVEVINKRVDKKNWDRKVVINTLLNYNDEINWIAPVRAYEKIKQDQIDKKARQQEIQQKKVRAKKEAKANKKAQKRLQKEQKDNVKK